MPLPSRLRVHRFGLAATTLLASLLLVAWRMTDFFPSLWPSPDSAPLSDTQVVSALGFIFHNLNLQRGLLLAKVFGGNLPPYPHLGRGRSTLLPWLVQVFGGACNHSGFFTSCLVPFINTTRCFPSGAPGCPFVKSEYDPSSLISPRTEIWGLASGSRSISTSSSAYFGLPGRDGETREPLLMWRAGTGGNRRLCRTTEPDSRPSSLSLLPIESAILNRPRKRGLSSRFCSRLLPHRHHVQWQP